MKKLTKLQKRKLIIRVYRAIGFVLALIGFLCLVSIENGLKYFNAGWQSLVLLLTIGVILIGLGAYMIYDSSSYKN